MIPSSLFFFRFPEAGSQLLSVVCQKQRQRVPNRLEPCSRIDVGYMEPLDFSPLPRVCKYVVKELVVLVLSNFRSP